MKRAADQAGWHPRFLATGAAADGALLAAARLGNDGGPTSWQAE